MKALVAFCACDNEESEHQWNPHLCPSDTVYDELVEVTE